ncbi:MAG TPA: efflux RND transporter periplasmic adaptor subunit [Polyangiaceae bacterium]
MSELYDPSPRIGTSAVATRVRLVIASGVFLMFMLGYGLYARAQSHTNSVAMNRTAKAVTVIAAQLGTYQAERHYVATTQPWVAAAVGPQLNAAFVDTVLVRPGDHVTRGQVLATLDCRDAAATRRAIAAQARAIETKQRALASEAARVNSMVDGGFAAPNEAEQKHASSESELAELMATQAKLAGSSLAVDDCVLRAPFDGEVSTRHTDPGAFVRPGTAIVSVIDRTTMRVCADVPEVDFRYIAKGTLVNVRLQATNAEMSGPIARVSPSANGSTRTVHFEVDLPDHERRIPVGTTATLTIQVGDRLSAIVIPANAASIRDDIATLFTVERGRAKKRTLHVIGESLGNFYLEPNIPVNSAIITEGRSLLSDGEPVNAVAPTTLTGDAQTAVKPQ